MKVLGFSKVSGVILSVLGLVGLVALIAWVGDLVALRSLRPLMKESLQHFSDFKKVGYRKPAYHPDMKDGEAWDMYTRAMEAAGPSSADARFVSHFLGGAKWDSSRAASILAENDSIIALVKEGVCRRRCTTPLDYEEGLGLRLPNYISLRNAAYLVACEGRLQVGKDPESALRNMIDGLIFAEDMVGGDLTLIGHMIGIVCLRICTRQIDHALSQFYLTGPQLRKLALAANTVATTWPPLSEDLEAEFRMATISFSTLGPGELEWIGLPDVRELSNRFFFWWYCRLRSSRQFFSIRRAQLNAVRFHVQMMRDLSEAEQRGWSAVDTAIDSWQSKVAHSGNWMVKATAPNTMGMHKRRFEGIAYTRMAGVGALLEIDYLKNGRWPESLNLVETAGLKDLLIDPLSEERLRYIVYAGGDSVSVYSVGINMVDDGGIIDKEKRDLVLVLHRPRRS